MRLLTLAALVAVCLATRGFAQTATLTASSQTLAPAGGSVVLTATVNYDNEPAALAWSIALPSDWTLESVAGPHIPSISPEPGATGSLEFAYTAAPAQRAEFTLVVRYPAAAKAATATPTVLVRAAGKLTTLTPAAVEFRASDPRGAQQRRN